MTSAPARGTDQPVRITILGAAFSANKGAASMAQAVVDVLPEVAGPCHIDVLTTYPDADRREQPNEVRIVGLKPFALLFPVLPIALLVALVRLAGGTGRSIARLHPATASMVRADVVLDLAGISFADGRPLPILVYNTLMTGVPLLLDAPVIKCSQAVGPFETGLNKRMARLVLPRLRAVLTRGARTHEHALALGLTNAQRANDLAFLMKVPEGAESRANELLGSAGVTRPFVVIAPSSVVKSYCTAIDLDYVGMLTTFVRDVRAHHDIDVVIAPHSARPGQPESRMNDLPICAEIHERVDDPRVHLVEESLRPAELRALIGAGAALVTSRFHAMISALATSTPVLVVGWSHKYEEVLGDFDLGDLVVPYDQLDAAGLRNRFSDLWERRETLTERINQHLPDVLEGTRTNFEVIRRELDRRSL